MSNLVVLLAVSCLLILDHGCSAAKYVGCYEYNEDIRLATGLVQIFEKDLTPQKCNTLCFEKGYVFAATRNGNKCLCINYENTENKAKIVEESLCDTPCNGNPLQKCGSELVISCYQTITSNSLAVGNSLGCYVDDREQRLLNQSRFELSNTNSPQKCLVICQELKFRFSGVKNSYECYCGNVFNVPGEDDSSDLESDDSDCNMPCPGDPTQNCGAKYNINIYRTGEPNKIPPAGFAGCFTFQSGSMSNYVEIMGNHTTPLRCMVKCFQHGYKYAGIKLGGECHCRNLAEGLQSVERSKCNIRCPGETVETAENCGGVDAISGYNLGISTQSGKRMGCFKDENVYPLLDGYKVDLIATNSAARCLSICFQLGFIYAGMRNGYKCLCGSSPPVNPQLVSDVECDESCPGLPNQKCGGTKRLLIYNTGFDSTTDDDVTAKCVKSLTKVNGVNVCKSAVIFKETFSSDSLFRSNWQHVVRFSGEEEYEFVTYTADNDHIHIQDSKLKIKPTLLAEDIIRNGEWKLEGCTGNPSSNLCDRRAVAYVIIPPIESASVNTKHSFNFKYGIVNIRAKVPEGDWIVPQFYLRAKDESYGPSYKSGVIRIGTVKGNKNLMCGNQSLGLNHVEHGVLIGNGDRVKGRTIKRSSDKPWSYKYHNYTVYWGPDKISFLVDNIQEKELLPDSKSILSELVGFTSEESEIWKRGSKIAPFDEEFYISIGVSIGGMREFDDNCVSDGHPKPWKNGEVKAMLKFWQDNPTWHATWSEKSILEVENIVVTAL